MSCSQFLYHRLNSSRCTSEIQQWNFTKFNWFSLKYLKPKCKLMFILLRRPSLYEIIQNNIALSSHLLHLFTTSFTHVLKKKLACKLEQNIVFHSFRNLVECLHMCKSNRIEQNKQSWYLGINKLSGKKMKITIYTHNLFLILKCHQLQNDLALIMTDFWQSKMQYHIKCVHWLLDLSTYQKY